jgi:hypothetical protein
MARKFALRLNIHHPKLFTVGQASHVNRETGLESVNWRWLQRGFAHHL